MIASRQHTSAGISRSHRRALMRYPSVLRCNWFDLFGDTSSRRSPDRPGSERVEDGVKEAAGATLSAWAALRTLASLG